MPNRRGGSTAAFCGGLLFLSLATVCRAQEAPAAIAAWASAQARPLAGLELGKGFKDLELLKRLIGSARVVSLGEGMHGSHDFLALRNRMFEFLVEELGIHRDCTGDRIHRVRCRRRVRAGPGYGHARGHQLGILLVGQRF